MIKTEGTVTINAPVERVFDYIANMENYHEWQLGNLKLRQDTSGPIGVGTRFVPAFEFMGQLESSYEVVDYQPNQKYTVKTFAGPVNKRLTQTFQGKNGGPTTVHYTMETEPKGLVALIGPFYAWRSRNALAKDLARLKEALEK